MVNRTYDALNRMLTEDYTGQAGTEITNTYDSCTNGIGYLCTASSTSALASNAYDVLGRISAATTTVLSNAYGMQYSYDRQGNVTSWVYPTGSQVNVSYNLSGMPNCVQRKASGGSFSDIISNYDYSPHGRIQNALFGNNASTTYFYDANAMYRLSNLQTTQNGATSTQNFAYTYDAVGNITNICNTANTSAKAETDYTYDALNRLLIASASNATSSPYTQTYDYDLLGNLLSRGHTEYSSGGTTTITPSILDTLPLALSSTTNVIHGNAISDLFTYTVPSGGSNKTLVVWLFYGAGRDRTFTTSQNGSPITMNLLSGAPYSNQSDFYYGTLANPTSGTFSIGWTGGATYYLAVVFTLQDVDMSNPIDATAWHNFSAATSDALDVTTNTDNALLLGITDWGNDFNVLTNSGAGELAVSSSLNPPAPNDFPPAAILGYKSSGSAGTHTMTTSATISATGGHGMLAIRSAGGVGTTTTSTYTYGGTGYANPHAVTQVANGVSTTTFLVR